MTRRSYPRVAALAGLLLVSSTITGPAHATAIPSTTTPSTTIPSTSTPYGATLPAAAQPVAGTGHATAHSVTVSSAAVAAAAALPARSGPLPAALGRDGRPVGASLPALAGNVQRPDPGSGNQSLSLNTSPNTNTVAPSVTSPHATVSPATTAIGVRGGSQGGTGCSASACTAPDVTAALNGTQFAETVNLQLLVFNKSSGAAQCTVSLASLLGATTNLSGPRIQYDNAGKRFSLLIDSKPSSSSDIAVQYLATSQADDACGAWWVYSIVFSISATYPIGALLDRPYLGQDKTSILTSTNNYSFGGAYLGSAAYAMPKSVAYTGGGFDVTTYSVAFSTAPATVGGVPIASTATTYWIAAVPGTGYTVYSMPTTPAGAISLKGTAHAPFSAPTHRVAQPGTGTTLDPGDGRIGSAAVQDGTILWFAHVVDDAGLPTVQYGGLDGATGQVETALAYHGTGTYDFNASIGVFPVGDGTDYIWINWAYTDPSAGQAVTDTVAGVAAGQGVPDEVGSDLALVTGASTSVNTAFGRYSSVAVDPSRTSSCPTGLTALTAQEYFTPGGLWTTELARTSFC